MSSSYFLPVKMSMATKWHLAWPCLPVCVLSFLFIYFLNRREREKKKKRERRSREVGATDGR